MGRTYVSENVWAFIIMDAATHRIMCTHTFFAEETFFETPTVPENRKSLDYRIKVVCHTMHFRLQKAKEQDAKPHYFFTDNSIVFTDGQFGALCKEHGIEHVTQNHGFAEQAHERMNYTFKTFFKKVTAKMSFNEIVVNAYIIVPFIAEIYNEHCHTLYDCSPEMLHDVLRMAEEGNFLNNGFLAHSKSSLGYLIIEVKRMLALQWYYMQVKGGPNPPHFAKPVEEAPTGASTVAFNDETQEKVNAQQNKIGKVASDLENHRNDASRDYKYTKVNQNALISQAKEVLDQFQDLINKYNSMLGKPKVERVVKTRVYAEPKTERAEAKLLLEAGDTVMENAEETLLLEAGDTVMESAEETRLLEADDTVSPKIMPVEYTEKTLRDFAVKKTVAVKKTEEKKPARAFFSLVLRTREKRTITAEQISGEKQTGIIKSDNGNFYLREPDAVKEHKRFLDPVSTLLFERVASYYLKGSMNSTRVRKFLVLCLAYFTTLSAGQMRWIQQKDILNLVNNGETHLSSASKKGKSFYVTIPKNAAGFITNHQNPAHIPLLLAQARSEE